MADTAFNGPYTMSLSCFRGHFPVYSIVPDTGPDFMEDLLYFLGVEEIFQLVPFAARRTEFRQWPYLSVYCECAPLWHVALFKITPNPRFCLNLFYNCRVEDAMSQSYGLFQSVDSE